MLYYSLVYMENSVDLASLAKRREKDKCDLRNALQYFSYAPVAQWIRAPGFEPGGRRFESCRGYHYYYSRLACR